MSWRFPVIAVLALALTGCGKGTYPAEGNVVYGDGSAVKALAGGQVELLPDSPGAPSPRGGIQADGSFKLGTFGPTDGALPGKYKVILTPPPQVGFDQRPKPAIDARYQSVETSGLTATIEPRPNTITLTVERPKE